MRMFAILALPAVAAADPLASSVARLTPEPAVVIVPRAAGKTPLERYRANVGAIGATTPLVAEIRLGEANGPDVVSVSDAHRDGAAIAITIENRRYDGPLERNAVWTPLVEVELGTLKPGSYTLTIDERVLRFQTEPKTARPVGRGLSFTSTLTIQ